MHYDAIRACELILQFTDGMNMREYLVDLKTKAAVEREFEFLTLGPIMLFLWILSLSGRVIL